MRRQHTGVVHRRQVGFDPEKYLGFTGTGNPFDIFPNLPTIDGFPGHRPDRTTSTTESSTTSTATTTTSATLATTLTTQSTTTTSSTTSSTTSTTSTTTTSSTSTKPTTTSSRTTTAPTTTAHKSSTSLLRASTSNTAIAASSTPTDTGVPSSGAGTGAIVGGVLAGLIAVVALVLAIMYFVRRSKKQNSEGAFDQSAFRRSAHMLQDPPTHEDTVARGFNPPPMAQRQADGPTYGAAYGQQVYDGSQYTQGQLGYGQQLYGSNQYNQGYDAHFAQQNYAPNAGFAGRGANFQSFSPGQVISPHPMHTPQSPNEQYAAPMAPYPVLTRQTSASSTEAPPSSKLNRDSLPAGDYVDLSRSSVSPFQAAQYVEISRRLNTEVPEGLSTAALDRELPPLPPKNEPSPFADPDSAPPSPGAQYAVDRRGMGEYTQRASSRPVSSDSIDTHEQTLDFPAPPSPVLAPTSRYRIDSTPPILPEINVQARGSVSSLSPMLTMGMGMRQSGAPAPGGMGLLSPGMDAPQSRFPMTPSPLASSFGLPSPEPAQAQTTFVEAPVTPRPAPAVTHDPKNRTTTYSMYDPEDAYGGI